MKVFYQQLDGLRALSVFAVILAHGLPFTFFRDTLGLGFWGVDLFFVLSGFLITEILLKQICAQEKPKRMIKSFYVKRTLRIFPIFYIVLLLAIGFNLDGCRAYCGYAFTYTLNFYNASSGVEGRYLSHIWSLCVEEQFYLFWPFMLLLIKPRFHKHLIMAVIIAAVLFRWVTTIVNYHNYHIYNYRSMPSALDALGIGAFLAYVKLFHLPLLKKAMRWRFVPALFFVLFLLLSAFNYPHRILFEETFLRLCVSVCCFFIIAQGVFGYEGRFGRFLQTASLRYLGKISYGIYLFHLLIQFFFDDYVDKYVLAHYSRSLPKLFQYNLHLLQLPLIILFTVLIAAASFRWIEKPFLQLKAQFVYS
ncbi:acyltransferase family protein [Flavisolibacter ginsenosidimutans]|uniref:acyltransferase family protein n=1 Tax=Flavisolibacter ginsenosidimutans TaxID=661481 RepID=UPI00155AE0FF|nr:acyltransferase [Flavisolibacter ginsenosidimutans]